MHPELTDVTQFVSLHSTAIANWVYLVLRTRHCMAHDRLQGSGEALRPHPPPVGTDTGTATARAIVSLSYHYARDSCRARMHCLCAAPTARAALMYLCRPVPCMHSLSCAVKCMHLQVTSCILQNLQNGRRVCMHSPFRFAACLLNSLSKALLSPTVPSSSLPIAPAIPHATAFTYCRV